MDGKINPIIFADFLNNDLATSFGMKPVSEMAFKTLFFFSSSTLAVPFITRETVAGDTCASFATSLMLDIYFPPLSIYIFSFIQT